MTVIKEVIAMYAVKVNNDNSITNLSDQTIFQGYKLADWFWVFTDYYYNNGIMNLYNGYIEFILPVSNKTISEKLIMKDELYNGLVKLCLSSKSRLTAEVGEVKTKFVFKDVSGNVIRESFQFTINIYDENTYHNQDGKGDSGEDEHGGCDCDIDKIIEKLRPLTYESVEAAETVLNSGEVKDIYLGKSVIIIDNGKYELYSVQAKDGGFTVEPVDTVGDGNNFVWEEE